MTPYERRRANGQCTTCLKPSRPGKARCEECTKRYNEKLRVKYHNTREQDLCVDCGSRTRFTTRCDTCAEHRNEEQRARRAAKKGNQT